jgi:hypothetical protein
MATQLAPHHSVSDHVARIEEAYKKTSESFFELVLAVKAARDDLGKNTFQKELAQRLSFSEATLSRLLEIGDCALLIKHQESLPPTLNTLYALAQIHSALAKTYDHPKAEEEFKKVLNDVDKKTEASDLEEILKQAKHTAAAASKKQGEEKVAGPSKTGAPDDLGAQGFHSLAALVDNRAVFRTVFIDPSDAVLKWAAGSGVFTEDIAKRHPIAALSEPPQGETTQGFVYCAASHIDAGLKLLVAAGFHFKDVFSPSSGTKGFDLLQSEKVVLRGERGTPSKPTLTGQVEASDAGALSIAESLGGSPRLYVFAAKPINGWTCSPREQAPKKSG